MHPVARKRRLTRELLALGYLVLVMREDKVVAAAVDVKLRTETPRAHGGAFDVPAGPPGSPRAVPRGLPRLRALPQREVHRVLLALVHLYPRARVHLIKPAVAELSVIGVTQHPEVHVAIERVRVSHLDEPRNVRDNVLNHRARAWILVRALHVQRVHVAQELVGVPGRELIPRYPELTGPVNYLVIHIRKVLDVANIEALVLQVAPHHVEHDVRQRVPDVRRGVHGGAADIHPHHAGLYRLERLLASGQRVVYV